MPAPGGGQVHDGARALARLPAARPLEVRRERLRDGASASGAALQARRPPQFWRKTRLAGRSLRAPRRPDLPEPSRPSREHARRGITHADDAPALLPPARLHGLPAGADAPARPPLRRGRRPAGEDQGVPGRHRRDAAPPRPRPPDRRRRASTRPSCARGPRGSANVHFEGRLDAASVAALFRGARAVVVPSLVYETFGYVVLEAFAERTPVVVRDLGALPELVAESGGGLVFDSPDGLVDCARAARRATTSCGDARRQRPARRGNGVWSEAEHLDRYFALIDERRRCPADPAGRADPPARHRVRVDHAGPPVDVPKREPTRRIARAGLGRKPGRAVTTALTSREPVRGDVSASSQRGSHRRRRPAPGRAIPGAVEIPRRRRRRPRSGRVAAGSRPGSRWPWPRPPAGRSPRSPTGRAGRAPPARRPRGSPRRRGPAAIDAGRSARAAGSPPSGPTKTSRWLGIRRGGAERTPSRIAGTFRRLDRLPTKRKKARSSPRPERPAGARRSPAASRARGRNPGSGPGGSRRSRSAGTPWTRATSRAVARDGTRTRSARRAARRYRQPNRQRTCRGKLSGTDPGQRVVDHQHGRPPPRRRHEVRRRERRSSGRRTRPSPKHSQSRPGQPSPTTSAIRPGDLGHPRRARSGRRRTTRRLGQGRPVAAQSASRLSRQRPTPVRSGGEPAAVDDQAAHRGPAAACRVGLSTSGRRFGTRLRAVAGIRLGDSTPPVVRPRRLCASPQGSSRRLAASIAKSVERPGIDSDTRERRRPSRILRIAVRFT